MQHMDCNSCRRTKTLKATTKGHSWTRYLGRLWSENVAMVTTESSLKIKGRLHCWLKTQQGTCNSPCPSIRNQVSFLTHVMGLAHRKGSFTERGMGHTQTGTAQHRAGAGCCHPPSLTTYSEPPERQACTSRGAGKGSQTRSIHTVQPLARLLALPATPCIAWLLPYTCINATK